MGILDNVKDVANLAKEVNRLDLHEKTVELMRQVTELAQENYDLKAENTRLKEQLDLRASLEFRSDAYWRTVTRPDGTPDTWAYYAKCWDSKGN